MEFCSRYYGTEGRISEIQAIVSTKFPSRQSERSSRGTTLIGTLTDHAVRSKPLGCSWGLTGKEIKLASDASHFLNGFGFPLFYAVVSDKDATEREIRERIRTFKAKLAKEQERERLPMSPAYVEMLEGWTGVHSNFLFPLRQERAEGWIRRQTRSPSFPGTTLDIQRAEGVDWFVSYCAKERTPQAKYVGGVGALSQRLEGSHQLGEGGGDRVRLARPVERALDELRGRAPRTRVYAKGLPRPQALAEPNKADTGRRLKFYPGATINNTVPSPSQESPQKRERFGLFLVDELPETKALAKATRTPQKRDKLPNPTLLMDYAPTVVDWINEMRRRRTCAEIGELIGLSRTQTNNAAVSRFSISRSVRRRVLELAKAA